MPPMHSYVQPDTYLFLRLPSETLRLIEIRLDTIIEVGRIGSFPSNLLIGRPYFHTYELLEKREDELFSRLRIVPPSELIAEAGLDDAAPAEARGDTATPGATYTTIESHNLLADDENVLIKNNRLTIDDASRQALSQEEIEELKKSSGGKEIIEKIMANHTALDEKTAYAKAKYALRKHKKYLKRFTILPMEIGTLIQHLTEKEPPRIMEMREETLALISVWSHAHFSKVPGETDDDKTSAGGRWLVVDDTGGLVVAGLAERMGILHAPAPNENQIVGAKADDGAQRPHQVDVEHDSQSVGLADQANGETARSKAHRDFPAPATSNTITLVHPAVQPNLSILKYFGYDTSNPNISSAEEEHPLHTHLKSLSWLQLLHPDEDPTYTEPEQMSEHALASLKSGKRGAYYKKRRRWERCKAIVDETRQGNFDGIVVASHMDPVSVLEHTVPLVRGGGHVVIYNPTVEPLTQVVDHYSKDRRGAYIAHLSKDEVPSPEDFVLDPRMLLAPTLQSSRIRDWQVLPGRTHPLMTGRGGAEGFVFTARKVVPLEGGVDARGNYFAKKRKVAHTNGGDTPNTTVPGAGG